MVFVKSILLLVIGFVLLIKGADFFVDGASAVARRFGIPEIVVGLTIAAFGTSAPEAAISINSALQQSAEISLGNVLGSNVLNVLLVLGVTACITPLAVKKNTMRYEIPFALLATVVLVGIGALSGKLTRVSGIILWILMIVFLCYLFAVSKRERAEVSDSDDNKMKVPVMLLCIVGGLAMIVVGSELTVDNATAIAQELGVDERIIALTIVAFGTSLPELVTSVVAARKGSVDLAVGNIIGSNIFNILFVIGTASLITNIQYSSEFLIDGIMCVVSLVLLELLIVRKSKLTRAGGVVMLAVYAAYFGYLIYGTFA